MDETENLTEQVEISDEVLNAFDDEWDEVAERAEATDAEPEDGDTHPETEEAAGSDSQEEESEESDKTETAENDQPKAGEDKPYTLKHMNEEKQYGLEEMLALAQKGMDYDGLRADRDRLRTDNAKMKGYEAFLSEMATRSGLTTIDDGMTQMRARWLQENERAIGKELSDIDAVILAQRKASSDGPPAESEETGETQEATPADSKRPSMFQAFVEEFPDVKADTIPGEVWQECRRTGDLAGAYRRYENNRLKAEIEALRQNQKNKERSTGSRRTSGAATQKDAFDEAWDSF